MKKLYEQFSAFFNIVLVAAMGSFTILGEQVKIYRPVWPVMVISKKQI